MKSVNRIVEKEDTIQSNWRKKAPSALMILNQYAAKQNLNVIDSLIYPFDQTIEEDTSRVMVIGKFIDDKKLYALDLLARDSIIRFFCFDGTKWESIGSGLVEDYTYTIDFRDFDGDKRNEIIAATNLNMNGNRWLKVFYASPDKNCIHYAGDFNTSFRINTTTKTVETYYEGSWYMDQEQTLYQWHGEYLLPVRKVIWGLKKKDMKSNRRFIEYYENPTAGKDTLVLKFRKTYREKNKKRHDLVDHFFGKDSLYGFEN